jgi:hypothetical protein
MSAVQPATPPEQGCTLAKNETVPRHFYALFCPVIVIDGAVGGDVIAIGGTIHINGSIHGSLIAIGQAIVINGSIAGSIRAVAPTMVITSQAVLSAPTADLSAAALTLEIDTMLPGDLWFAGRDIVIQGAIQGTRHLFLLPTPDRQVAPWADYVFGTVQTWFGLVFVQALLLILARARVKRASMTIESHFWATFWRGQRMLLLAVSALIIGYLVAGLIAGALVLFSLGGFFVLVMAACLSIGLGVTGAGLAMIGIVAPALVAYTVGRRINRQTGADRTQTPATALVSALLTGGVVVAALVALPVIGIIAAECCGAIGIGALLRGPQPSES